MGSVLITSPSLDISFRFGKERTTFMRGEILGYVKCDISADLKRDNHSWWGLKRESPRVSVLSELMWACYCLDYKRGELTAIIEKDHFGLICSDNNKGSSNNLSSKAQSSSIRHRLGTQSGWIHFTCFLVFFFFLRLLCLTVRSSWRQTPWISMRLVSLCDTTWE